MLRWGLLGGDRPPLPWEFFVALGGAILAVCPVSFALLFPYWASVPTLGYLELGAFLAAGLGLLAVGVRRHSRPPTPTPPRPERPPRW